MQPSILWTRDEPIIDIAPDIDIPEWVEDREITAVDIAAILQGGCASGAYMPAVHYGKALATMSKHGDEVLEFIVDRFGELLRPCFNESWSGLASHYLSHAVELWAASIEDELADAIADAEDDA